MSTVKGDLAEAEEWRQHRVRAHYKPCWTCSLPQVQTINELMRRGWKASEIMGWLIAKHGFSGEPDAPESKRVTRNKLQHHIDGRHHERPS